MSTVEMTERISKGSPRFKARLAGGVYLVTFLTGLLALFVRGKLGFVALQISAGCYIVVTLLFYYIFGPVNRSLSLLAAAVSLVGLSLGSRLLKVNPLVFFGFYCLLMAYLIFRSTFLPHFLAALMAFAGLGWLTFFSTPLANTRSPYNYVPGILGEGVLYNVAPREGRERTTMEGAGRRRLAHKGGTNVVLACISSPH
jgi:hypothetical protein